MDRCKLFALIALAVLSPPAILANATSPEITYEADVRPILKLHCFDCHGGQEPKAGLDLRLRRLMAKGGKSGPAIEPGKPEASLLLRKVTQGEMPPGEKKLSPDEISLLGRWIAGGAPTARDEPDELAAETPISPEEASFWAFQPVKAREVPAVEPRDRARTPIDAWLLAAMRAKGLRFSADAAKATFCRRVYFDLIGLPPTPAEVEEFMADEVPDAYERLIDRLLASPRYGERWGRHWLDVAGYADSEGYTAADAPRSHAYKYRDYVIRSFNADKPFDDFLREQLAGDEMVPPPHQNLSEDAIDRLVATGFLRMGPDGTATEGIDNELARNHVISDTIKIMTTALLGLSVGCAQCHDHRYDPISQTDYYRLRALLEPAYDWKQWRKPAERLISLYSDADRARAAAVEAEAAQVANEKSTKQAQAISAALEGELTKFDSSLRESLRTAFNTPEGQRSEEQRQLLKTHPSVNITPGVLYQYNQQAADELKKHDERIAEIRGRKPPEDFVAALTEVPGHVPVTYLFHRGDHQQPKDAVKPGPLRLECLPGQTADIPEDDPGIPTSGRRLAYARWLTSGRHPLVARVLVNRFWMHHFGRGLVATPADFGAIGERPTHPELLDWLANDFVEHGWRLKRLHKMILNSTAYRQASERNAEMQARDPDNRCYWRAPVRRLDAEVIRDSMLSVSGVRNGKMFGRPVPVKEDAVGQIVVGIDRKVASNMPGDEVPLGSEAYRRSVYVEVRRSKPLAILHSFDAPVMETNCDRRPTSTVATQSLMLMNSDFALLQARLFAERLRRDGGAKQRDQIVLAWRLAYARAPEETEVLKAMDFLKEQAAWMKANPPSSASEDKKEAGSDPELQSLINLCQVILGSNEFLYVD